MHKFIHEWGLAGYTDRGLLGWAYKGEGTQKVGWLAPPPLSQLRGGATGS